MRLFNRQNEELVLKKNEQLEDALVNRSTEASMHEIMSRKEQENQKKTILAFVLMFIYVILTAFSDSVSKLVYIDHPTLSVFEFLFWRTTIQFIFLVGLMNRSSKTYLVDKIERDLMTPLVIRVVSGVTSFLCLYYAIKYLPIFLVSLILNTSPIFTSFMAYIFLKERVSRAEIFALFFAFFGVYVLISSSKEGTPQQDLDSN